MVLFKYSYYLVRKNYLSLCIVGPNEADAQVWAGFVESRLRKLVSDNLGRSLPLKKIQLWPKKFEVCVADRGALLTQAQRQNSITYFIGFQADKLRMRGEQLNLEAPLQNFREWDLSRYQPLEQGMDVLVKVFKVKELPKICFEGVYEGGKEEAMKKRRLLRDTDPVRQEKKRLARLADLKAKMEEIRRKKEDEINRKRTRDEAELEEEELKKVAKQEETSMDEALVSETGSAENDEANQLDTIFDAIQDEGERKTREEAEADRQKLLAGELLVEGDEGLESEDEAGYTGDGARQSFFAKPKKEDNHKDPRSLPPSEEDAELLKSLGYALVSDDEAKIIAANLSPPLQSSAESETDSQSPPKVRIKFRESFDIVELDSCGHVIDKGDDDFTPSKTWIGRRAGFEFKLGERGLGYYRTGKKVVVPSNTAY